MTSVMIPEAVRMRDVYPLIEEDGSCSLIYDLERARVLDVPEELQGHVASSLDNTGDLDQILWDWLQAEDLLTAEGATGSEETEGMGGTSTLWSLGRVFRRDGEIQARIDNAARESALEALDFIFKQGLGASRVTLHLSWGGGFPATQLLEAIVVESSRRAAAARQEVRYELSLDSWVVTPAVATFLADYPLHVRLHCGSFPSVEPRVKPGAPAQEAQAWKLAEKGVRLLSGIAERVTVQCVLGGGARLSDLWAWAKDLGVRHLDPVRLEDDDPLSPELRRYRQDLLAIADEVCAGLSDPQPPIDCQPLSRVVGKLMRSEPFARPPRLSTETPWGSGDFGAPHEEHEKEVEPALFSEMEHPLGRGSAERGEGAAAESEAVSCFGCWARYLCSHSALPSSPVNSSADCREPTEERCGFWRAEVEVGLRLSHRLAEADPLEALRLFDEPEAPIDPLDRPDPLGAPKAPF
jgi:hypothetical protein